MEKHRVPMPTSAKPSGAGPWQLSLFAWVLVLYLLVCVLPAGAVLWVMARQIDDQIRDHNRQQSQVSSLVHSVQQKARTGLGNAISLPKQLTEELAAKQLTAASSPNEFLNRYVCATALPEAADRTDVKRLIDLLRPRRRDAYDRPAALRTDEDRKIIRDFFPPLRAFLSEPDGSAGRRPDLEGLLAWLAQDSRRYEEIVALMPTLARELPPCNAVLLVDGGDSRLPVLAHNTVRRYGQLVPHDFRKPEGLAATLGQGRSAKRVAAMVRALARSNEKETLRVSERFDDLDVFGDYCDAEPDDYRRWSLVLAAPVELPPLVAGAVRRADGQVAPGPVLAVFVVSWTVIQAEIASDQLYKRSRNLDRLRMLVLEREPDGRARCIASGVPGLFNQVVDPGAPERSRFGPSLARQLTTLQNGSLGNNQRFPVEFQPGPVAPPVDLPPLLVPTSSSAGAAMETPELLFGEVRPVDPPSAPGEWKVLSEQGQPMKIDWLALIYYDPEEGSVGPRVRQWNLITSLVLVAVMLAASWYVARTLSAPTNALRDMAQALAAGQFNPTGDSALPVPQSWAHPREITELETAFRDMAAQVVTKRLLEDKNAELQDKNRRLDETVAELTAARNALQERGRQLEDKNAELERTISQLREAQQELMVSNMLASLGTISGEYAHAVNNGLQLPLYTLDELAGQLCRAAEAQARSAGATVARGPTVLTLSEEMADNIRMSMESIQHTAAFVTQFRDFARSDNYEMSPLELNRLVASVADVWRPQLRRRQIELTARLGEPPTVMGNDALLMHVLVNLILNSRDAIRQRRNQSELEAALVGQIALTTARDGDGSALLSVADNGCGISPDVAAKIFQPMFTTKPRGEGSGLGLSSVLRAVRQHHGQIWFDSGAGRGTTFYIRLPAAG